MHTELIVTIKGTSHDSEDDLTFRAKHILEEEYTIDANDPVILRCVNKTLSQFDGIAESIKVNITLQIS